MSASAHLTSSSAKSSRRGPSPQAGGTPAATGFTILEVVVVMCLIVLLAGLVLGVTNYVQEKGKRSRAEVEIAAMSAALESYKADNGVYPRGNASPTPGDVAPFDTDKLDAQTGLRQSTELNPDPNRGSAYVAAGLAVYKLLSGDIAGNRQPTAKPYFIFPSGMLWPKGSSSVNALVDPFGNCYGYSTSYQWNSNQGFNPTFDLWSTSGLGTGATPTPSPARTPLNSWVKNW